MAYRTRRRRRPAVAWLPNFGHVEGLECEDNPSSVIDGELVVPAAGATAGCPVIAVHGLTADFSAEATEIAATPVLSDYTQGGYRLRRIVGKLFAARELLQSGSDWGSQPGLILLSAGFMVLRADPTTGAPIGNLTLKDYDPAGLRNIRDPWIWRRTWLLGFGQVRPDINLSVSNYDNIGRAYPQGTIGYGSVQDGPHIDAKTARKIGPEERTFFVISGRASTYTIGVTPSDTGVRYTLDWRMLATPIRMTNRGNASR